MKNIFFLFFLISTLSFSQTITKDSIQIEVESTKFVVDPRLMEFKYFKVRNNQLRKVKIKAKIESTSENMTKLSAFSLIDTKNKLRYRLADYAGYIGGVFGPDLLTYRKSQIYDKDGDAVKFDPPFGEYEKDYFNDFDMEGYTNIEEPINFGTTKRPKLSVLFFGETTIKKVTADLYFLLLIDHIDLDYELYYKDEKVGDIKF